ncbi:MAG: energy-coupling factor ABC transporter ATP-binding protein [Gammaproteobacteria bacterium]|nr:MAG: energy-coupling factor ABC transporter ATP-binding protein [Gammaproteobacteria bacterium]
MDPLIQTLGLSYCYPGREEALSHVDFSLSAGDRVALTGPNGAGKTTFLHLLVGLKKAKAGQVYAFGKPRETEQEFMEVRARAGFLFQDPDDQLFCPTVLEDVAFGPLNLGKTRSQALAVARDTLATLGMAGFEDRVAHQLSGGEKRMVALASVLSMEPEVLLLDEPTNALDKSARQKLIKTLLALPQSMILVSHDEAFVSTIATRHIRLESALFVETENWQTTRSA